MAADPYEGAPTTGSLPDLYPPPHRRYMVRRGGVVVTATPCYGMHNPWWVVMTLETEVAPVAMRDGDTWEVLGG